MSALEPIAYRDGDIALTGWLARPAGKPRAAVVIFPTIANFNAPMERRALMLAEQGYLAMVADFYGQAVESFEASGPLAQMLRTDPETYRASLRAAIAALREASGGGWLADGRHRLLHGRPGRAGGGARRGGPRCRGQVSTGCWTRSFQPKRAQSEHAC